MNKVDVRKLLENAGGQVKVSKIDRSSPVPSASFKKKVAHREVERFKSYHSGDCYLYEIKCACGKVFGGWTPSQAEKDFEVHLKKGGKNRA